MSKKTFFISLSVVLGFYSWELLPQRLKSNPNGKSQSLGNGAWDMIIKIIDTDMILHQKPNSSQLKQ